MQDHQLLDPVDLEEALTAERYLLFKHSKACSISVSAFKAWASFVAAHPEVPTGWIEVRTQRPLSDEVQRRTGVDHESPQALWLEDGLVAWHASHWDITAAALARAVGDRASPDVA